MSATLEILCFVRIKKKINSQQDRSVQVSRGAATLCKADPQQSV